jgi:GNAT superfamily N-acetyltransferase
MVEVRRARPDELPAAQRFYAATGYHAPIDAAAAILLACQDRAIVGAVWLEHDQDLWVLRGMRVQPAHQRQGIGTQLLRAALEAASDQPVYCVPYAHVGRLLERAGFVPLPENQAPPTLLARATEYRARGLDVVLMRRQPTAAPNRVAV